MTVMRSSYASVAPYRQRKITATVRFGLITMKCKGRGICSVTADGPDLKLQECNYAKARICIEPNNGLAFFLILLQEMKCRFKRPF